MMGPNFGILGPNLTFNVIMLMQLFKIVSWHLRGANFSFVILT